jgi:hypothetical protein
MRSSEAGIINTMLPREWYYDCEQLHATHSVKLGNPGKDWDYFQFGGHVKPHMEPDGYGKYELILLVALNVPSGSIR